MSKFSFDSLGLEDVLNIFLIGLGFWFPVFLTYQYQQFAEKKKEKAFNRNTLILLSQELEVIRTVNERIRKSSHRIVDGSKKESRMVIHEFPHRLDTKTLESLIANLVLYRNQNQKLLRYLIELKSNLTITNETLEFNLLWVFLENNPEDEAGEIIEGYFEGVFKYLEANFQFIEKSKEEIQL